MPGAWLCHSSLMAVGRISSPKNPAAAPVHCVVASGTAHAAPPPKKKKPHPKTNKQTKRPQAAGRQAARAGRLAAAFWFWTPTPTRTRRRRRPRAKEGGGGGAAGPGNPRKRPKPGEPARTGPGGWGPLDSLCALSAFSSAIRDMRYEVVYLICRVYVLFISPPG
jgi:hypothetical protein